MSSFLKAKQDKDNFAFIFGKNHFINNFSLGFILLFSGIEVYKISLVVSGMPFLITFVFWILLGAFLYLTAKIDFEKIYFGKYSGAVFVVFIAVLTTVVSVGFINPDVLKIPEIQEWLSRFSAGLNPYASVDENYLPMVYFILTPFEMLGNILLANTAAVGIFLFTVFAFNRDREEKISVLALLFLTPQIYVQFSHGATQLLFVAICLLVFIVHSDDAAKSADHLSITLVSILCGLLMLTMVELVPLVVLWIIYTFRRNTKHLLLVLGMSLCTALLISFALFNFNFDMIYSTPLFENVFTELGMTFMIFVVIAALYAGWISVNLREVIFISALLITFVWGAQIVYHWKEGTAGLFQLILYKNSGLTFSAFFLFLISVHKYRVDRYLGRIYPIQNEND